MKKLTSKGFGLLEVMVALCAILVVVAISVVLIIKNSESSNINMFKKLGDDFAYKVSIYKDRYPRLDNIYYLDYMLNDKIDIELKSPVDSQECDRYESYVRIDEDGKKHVTMRCGNYFVTGKHEGEYEVYEISEWQNEFCNGCQQDILYNYKKDGVEVLEKYLTEKEFIREFNNREDIEIVSAGEVQLKLENSELVNKMMYREKKLVKKVG